ncbi:MAG TPA: PAS domain-containing protein, partial [Verrucomicrobiae bacterium]|nr:PAS domain-containing protein [Verrucomicrobiae bacterium]
MQVKTPRPPRLKSNGSYRNGSTRKKSTPDNHGAGLAELRGRLGAIEQSLAVAEHDLNGTLLSANARYLALTGYTLEEVQHRPHSVQVAPAEREGEVYQRFWRELKEGKPQAGDYKRLKKDGKEIWLRASYQPVPDAQGNPVKIVEIATDWTEQHKI